MAGEGFQQGEGVGNGEGIEVGEGEGGGDLTGVWWDFETMEEGIGIEPASGAIGTGAVAPVAGEEHADVHLVSLGFEPAEVAFHPVPEFGPGTFRIGGVIVVLTFHHPALVFGGEIAERDVHGDLQATRRTGEISLAFGTAGGLPGFDNALRQGQGAVGQGEVGINADDAAEALAGGAGTDGIVEAEQGGGRFAIVEVASGAVVAGAEVTAV